MINKVKRALKQKLEEKYGSLRNVRQKNIPAELFDTLFNSKESTFVDHPVYFSGKIDGLIVFYIVVSQNHYPFDKPLWSELNLEDSEYKYTYERMFIFQKQKKLREYVIEKKGLKDYLS